MKSRRHFMIMDIIANQRVATQEELCEALRTSGFDVTQATVSRDIKELHLIKVPDDQGYHYALPDATTLSRSRERMKRVFRDNVMSMDFSENLIVIKTLPGGAQAVASVIDTSEWLSILGTVAGDDTIFVAVKTKQAVQDVLEEFRELIS
ncbi:arginine repressor [Syntrophomonas erecta]